MAATGVEAEAVRPGSDSLSLRFIVTGVIADLFLPPVTTTERTDELWRRTCFEAFLRPSPGTAYYEFNFAPSTQWAAYSFTGYRSGMNAVRNMETPHVEVRSDGGSYELQASLTLDHLAGLPRDAAWRLGLSAVIEEADGNISYWALAHPPGKPDFHHSDCFTLELPSA